MRVTFKQCPRCAELGRDRSQDNLAEYPDGHCYCFACGYYGHPSPLQSLRANLVHERRSEETSSVPSGVRSTPDRRGDQFPADSLTSAIPNEGLRWLLKYDIRPDEIEFYGLKWHPARKFLCFSVGADLWTCRNFSGQGPKWLTFGDKSFPLLFNNGAPTRDAFCYVLVEDVVSAIKVARVAPCFPLLGVSIPIRLRRFLLTTRKPVRIWLDFDKAEHSGYLARGLAQTLDCATIVSPLDPKDYDTSQIFAYIHGTLPQPNQSSTQP